MRRIHIGIKIQNSRLGFLFCHILRLHVFLYLLICLLYGCSTIQTPDDYYKQVLEIEKNSEETQKASKQKPIEEESPAELETTVTMNPSVEQFPEDSSDESSESALEEEVIPEEELPSANIEETPVVEQDEAFEESEPPRREAIEEPPSPMPIAVAPELIKIALTSAGLEINVRNLELVNGRLTNGKNSVRINFFSDSTDTMDSKFVAICAVIYHLDREAKTIDVIVGMAEDDQSNLLAIYQSNMSDVIAWMDNKLSPGEWRSRITKKVL